MLKIRTLQSVAVACSLGVGCAMGPAEEDLATQAAPVIGSTVDHCIYPEVGLLEFNGSSLCTAELVAPDMILSAAHCFFYGNSDAGSGATGFRFVVNDRCGTASRFDVIRYRSYVGSEDENRATLGIDDVAIAQLQASVPSPMASPMSFFPGGLPVAGTWVTKVGHGGRTLSDCAPGGTDSKKAYLGLPLTYEPGTNKQLFPYPYIGVSCPKDSGGPVFMGSDRRVFWVNSSMNLSNPDKVYNRYGEVWRLTTQIEDAMANWSCPGGAWWDGAAVDKNQRYPYARVCGMDNQNYECRPGSHQWQALGGTCGNNSCQCANGAAFGDVAVAPDRTTCGSTVCGRDEFVYRCTSTGWKADLASRCGPLLKIFEGFSAPQVFTSAWDAAWGGAASWWVTLGGLDGNALHAERTSIGSSARVKVYSISPNTWYAVLISMRVDASTADFWAEAAVKLGSFSAADFDSHPGTWRMLRKFDKTTGGSGGAWTTSSWVFNSGANTQISVGYKLGNLSGTAPVARWDSLVIQ